MMITKMITNSIGTLNQCHMCPAWLPTSKPEDSTIQLLSKSFDRHFVKLSEANLPTQLGFFQSDHEGLGRAFKY